MYSKRTRFHGHVNKVLRFDGHINKRVFREKSPPPISLPMKTLVFFLTWRKARVQI